MAEPINKEAIPERPIVGKKLNLRKKLGMVTLITPPSFFQNQNRSFALINLSKRSVRRERVRGLTRPVHA